jgi:hypothetical protein
MTLKYADDLFLGCLSCARAQGWFDSWQVILYNPGFTRRKLGRDRPDFPGVVMLVQQKTVKENFIGAFSTSEREQPGPDAQFDERYMV